MVSTVKVNFPHLKILSRAYDRRDAYELMEAGVDNIYRETLDSSLRLGADALKMLGFKAQTCDRAARIFLRHDEDALIELIKNETETSSYSDLTTERISELEELILKDIKKIEIAEADNVSNTEGTELDNKEK
jgi:monovalent cation:H+ antiporter-2, CPA2 family